MVNINKETFGICCIKNISFFMSFVSKFWKHHVTGIIMDGSCFFLRTI